MARTAPATSERDAGPAPPPARPSSRGAPMSDIGSQRPAVDTTAVAYSSEPEPTGWTGWIVFASFMMFMLGTFQVVQGVVAIFDDGFYAVTEKGLLVNVD